MRELSGSSLGLGELAGSSVALRRGSLRWGSLGALWELLGPVLGPAGPVLRPAEVQQGALWGPVCLSGPAMSLSLSGALWGTLGARRELSGGPCLPVWACHEPVRGSLGRSGTLWGTLGALRELSGGSLGALRELVGGLESSLEALMGARWGSESSLRGVLGLSWALQSLF